jgi:general secretion pathway protein E
VAADSGSARSQAGQGRAAADAPGRTPARSPGVADLVQRIDPELVSAVPYAFARKHGVLAAFVEDGRVQMMCARPPDVTIVAELRRRLGRPMAFRELAAADFDSLMRQAYDRSQSEATQMVQDLGESIDLEVLAQDIPVTTDLLEMADQAPVVRLINALLSQAIREDASDIHLEAFEQRSVVRFRVDGVLRDILEPPRALHSALVSRLKVMASLDIAEKRLPQDGRISVRVGDRPIDVRVSTLPTRHGERIVLRLLDKQGARLRLEILGMGDGLRTQFDRLIHLPNGIILVTGPTGSGKTTTLYAALSRLDRLRMNILTVEDPIEYDLDGIGQTQVQSRIGLTFAAGLRSILRQDPDVVLVGEIRDLETAEIAVQASLTGHLVLSTLHTNSAVGAIIRLVDMGVERFLIASSLQAVLAQRLVRRLCVSCREPYAPSEAELEILALDGGGRISPYRAVGCDRCDYTGYRGRTGIYELIALDDDIRRMVHDGAPETDILAHARRRSPSLMADGVRRIREGITTVDEVVRVTSERG